jgi:hypothetical protein
VLRVASGALLALALAGCGGTPSGPEDPADQAACERLLDDAPAELGGQPRRDSGAGPYVLTWGDDDVLVLRCGVAEPTGLTATSDCIAVGGVDWFAPEEQAADQTLDATLTTIGRDPRVQVVVPAALRPPGDVLVELGPVVREHTDETDPCR